MGIPERTQQFYHDQQLISKPRYVPQSFLDSLAVLDPTLEPRWNPVKVRWEIWRAGYYVLTVQTNEGEYQPLDNRVLQKLFVIDTHRYKSKFDYIRNLHLEDSHLMGMKRKEQDEFVRACHRDMSPFLRGRKSVTASKVRTK